MEYLTEWTNESVLNELLQRRLSELLLGEDIVSAKILSHLLSSFPEKNWSKRFWKGSNKYGPDGIYQRMDSDMKRCTYVTPAKIVLTQRIHRQPIVSPTNPPTIGPRTGPE